MALLLAIVLVVLTAAWPAFCQTVNGSLPDSPSVQRAAQMPSEFARDPDEASLFEASERASVLMREDAFAASDRTQQEVNAVRRLFYPRTIAQQPVYSDLNGETLMSRAMHAASHAILIRDFSGKDRLNTAYLLRTLASVAADSASKPYWRRSVSDPFGDFGSMIGNDAGTNLWHEFGPGIAHLMKNCAPKFLDRIAQQIEHPQSVPALKPAAMVR